MPDDAKDGAPTQERPGLSAIAGKKRRQFAIVIGLCIVAGSVTARIKGLAWLKLILGSLVALAVVLAVVGIVPPVRKRPPD